MGCNTTKYWNITTYKYDQQGNIIEKDYFDNISKDHGGSWNEKWAYDAYGNVDEISVEFPDGKSNYKIATKYEYDSNNNWVKATTTFYHVGISTQEIADNENHEHIVISERKLNYY